MRTPTIVPQILNMRKDICDELISTVVCRVLDGMPSPSTFGKTGPQITFRPSAVHKLLHTGLLDLTAGSVSTIYVLAWLQQCFLINELIWYLAIVA